jgi:hypothetical protein
VDRGREVVEEDVLMIAGKGQLIALAGRLAGLEPGLVRVFDVVPEVARSALGDCAVGDRSRCVLWRPEP